MPKPDRGETASVRLPGWPTVVGRARRLRRWGRCSGRGAVFEGGFGASLTRRSSVGAAVLQGDDARGRTDRGQSPHRVVTHARVGVGERALEQVARFGTGRGGEHAGCDRRTAREESSRARAHGRDATAASAPSSRSMRSGGTRRRVRLWRQEFGRGREGCRSAGCRARNGRVRADGPTVQVGAARTRP